MGIASVTSTPYVLLHGGRHGGWCWHRVAALLRAAGHVAYTPTLTGLGERSHLLSRDIGLDTHIQDLVSVFEFEDLRDCVLVGHSYGGMVVSGAMERIADRVRTVVFLDALLPYDGESVLDLIGPERAAQMAALADQGGEGWFIPPGNPAMYGVTDPDDAAWVERRLTAQPLKTYQDKITGTAKAWSHPGMFVECTPSSIEPFVRERARRRSATDPRFHYRTLDAAHDAMITSPKAVTELLLDALTIA